MVKEFQNQADINAIKVSLLIMLAFVLYFSVRLTVIPFKDIIESFRVSGGNLYLLGLICLGKSDLSMTARFAYRCSEIYILSN
jgi:hypothetical protein